MAPSIRSYAIPVKKSVEAKKNPQESPYPQQHVKQLEFTELLLEFVVGGGVPFSIVESHWFRTLISSLDPKLSIPCDSTIMNKLDKRHQMVCKVLG